MRPLCRQILTYAAGAAQTRSSNALLAGVAEPIFVTHAEWLPVPGLAMLEGIFECLAGSRWS